MTPREGKRWLLAILMVVGTTRAHAAAPVTLEVLAAASLSEVLPRVAARWTARQNPRVSLTFDASSRLARQLEAGARADVFVSADHAWMEHLERGGQVVRGTRVELAGNRLVAVVRPGFTGVVAGARDLAGAGVRTLALAGENVPAGVYARAALSRMGAWDALAPRVVRGESVRTALAWVASGEADAGVVYATDARVEPRVRVAFTLPEDAHPPIRYPAAVTRRSSHAEVAARFLAFCGSDEAVRLFDEAGFTRVVAR